MATSNGSKAVLLRAIKTADEATLRSMLKSLCEDSEECRKQVAQHLLVSTRDTPSTKKRKVGVEAAQQQSLSKKAKEAQTPRYERCITCNQSFDVTKNTDDACRTHDDYLEIDEEYFPDDDEIQSGAHIDTETDWRVEQCPEGFIWACCDEPANGKPCVVGKHIAK